MTGYVANIETHQGTDEFTKFIDVDFTSKKESACSWSTRQAAAEDAAMLEHHNIAINTADGGRHVCKGYRVEERAPGEYIICLEAPFRLVTAQEERRIKEEALISPKAAFMQLLIDIDRELRILLASSGVLNRYLADKVQTFPIALQHLASASGAKIPNELKERITEFWNFRNNVVHGESEVPIRAFDLGLMILGVLRNLPRPTYIVKQAEIPLFEDQYCQHQRPVVKGVLLETYDAYGKLQITKVHPSTKQYVDGMSVSWEWDIPIAYR